MLTHHSDSMWTRTVLDYEVSKIMTHVIKGQLWSECGIQLHVLHWHTQVYRINKQKGRATFAEGWISGSVVHAKIHQQTRFLVMVSSVYNGRPTVSCYCSNTGHWVTPQITGTARAWFTLRIRSNCSCAGFKEWSLLKVAACKLSGRVPFFSFMNIITLRDSTTSATPHYRDKLVLLLPVQTPPHFFSQGVAC